MLPFSTLAGWGIVVVGALSSLHVLGVNIQPLLTVGGVGGLAVGFGAQAVTSNAISGINLVQPEPLCSAAGHVAMPGPPKRPTACCHMQLAAISLQHAPGRVGMHAKLQALGSPVAVS